MGPVAISMFRLHISPSQLVQTGDVPSITTYVGAILKARILPVDFVQWQEHG